MPSAWARIPASALQAILRAIGFRHSGASGSTRCSTASFSNTRNQHLRAVQYRKTLPSFFFCHCSVGQPSCYICTSILHASAHCSIGCPGPVLGKNGWHTAPASCCVGMQARCHTPPRGMMSGRAAAALFTGHQLQPCAFSHIHTWMFCLSRQKSPFPHKFQRRRGACSHFLYASSMGDCPATLLFPPLRREYPCLSIR